MYCLLHLQRLGVNLDGIHHPSGAKVTDTVQPFFLLPVTATSLPVRKLSAMSN